MTTSHRLWFARTNRKINEYSIQQLRDRLAAEIMRRREAERERDERIRLDDLDMYHRIPPRHEQTTLELGLDK